MRKTTFELASYYVREMGLEGKALEIGGHSLASCAKDLFPEDRFEYFDLNFERSDIPKTIIGDITNAENVQNDSFDVVFSSDVFEHINRPWLAASEIMRILKPGGLSITATLWAWRSHPCPIDYWRFSPECLEFLFSDLVTLESGFDLSERRHNKIGIWNNFGDAVPLDRWGGFRENWAVYHVGVKPPFNGTAPLPFKETDHSCALHLRQDVRGDARRVISQRRRFARIKMVVARLKHSPLKKIVPPGMRNWLRNLVRKKI